MTIKDTELEDAVLLSETIDKVARERQFLAITQGFPAEGTQSFIKHLQTIGGVHLVALDGNHIVGWCDISPLPFEGMKHVGKLGMGIAKDYRNMGLGRKILRAAQERAYDNGITKIELEVFSTNVAAIRLYETSGFVLEGRRAAARLLDGVSSDILLYAKRKEHPL